MIAAKYPIAGWNPFALVLLTWCSLGASEVRAQTFTCLAADTSQHAISLADYMKDLVTSSDSLMVVTRGRYGIPAGDSSGVTVEVDAATCIDAGTAYHAVLHGPESPPVSRTLVVVKLGQSNYVVVDPDELAGEFTIHVVFNTQWERLAVFSG